MDDQASARETVTDRLEVVSEDTGLSFDPDCYDSFEAAAAASRSREFDLAIVDLRDGQSDHIPGNDRGLQLFGTMKSWGFVPTVFYTAYASDIGAELRDLRFVRVVPKEHTEQLDVAVRDLIESGAVTAARDVKGAVRDELRNFMWSQADRPSDETPEDLRSQVFRRAAARLDRLAPEGATGAGPSRMYLVPPMSQDPECGAVLRDRDDEWWVVATPACDLVMRGGKRKAGFIRLLRAKPLEEMGIKHRNDVATGSKPRFFHLAAHGPIPELVVDLQHVRSEPCEWWSSTARGTIEATLDAPFAEALLVRYGQYAGRVGTPTLDKDRLGN
ncbi:hypothetical protein [Yimella lutea]|uniref:hypothetical protein n=1 Tax=Yimella lutea TaxID=587872 RepID=UPI001153C930|nr:hypothetical protein [Yimella lutea]